MTSNREYIHLVESSDETLVFEVISSSRPDTKHNVYYDKDNGWVCSCEQYYYRKKECKHMRMAREYYMSFYKKMLNSNKVFHEKQ